MKNIVILNEQHTLMEEQKQLLNATFGEEKWEIKKVPAEGWTKEQMDEEFYKLDLCNVIFASPIPYLLKKLSYNSGFIGRDAMGDCPMVYVFHNDNREKKELPNGKIIYTIAKTGWQLI